MKSIGRFFLLLFLLLGGISASQAQERDTHAFRLWYDLYFMHTLNSNFRYIVQTNFKHETSSDLKQVGVRAAFIYTMHEDLYLQAGLTMFITNEDDNNLYEIRPWQGVNVFFPRIGQLYLNNFIRLEERFFVFDYDEEHSMSLRIRYGLSTYIPLNHKQIIEKTIYLWPHFEVFIPDYEKGLDLNMNRFRGSLGLGYRFDKHIRSEISYMYEKSKQDGYHYFSENSTTVRLTLRYLLNNGQKVRGL
jgi:hypothetical protein